MTVRDYSLPPVFALRRIGTDWAVFAPDEDPLAPAWHCWSVIGERPVPEPELPSGRILSFPHRG
jgi:hypothetical protein